MRVPANKVWWISSLLTGLLLAVSYPPVSLHFLAWIALVPLIRATQESGSWRTAYSLAVAAWAICFAIAFSWVLFHARISAALALLTPLVLLPLIHAAPFAIAVALGSRFGNRAFHVALPLSWLAAEWILSHGPFAVPWTLLANTQADALVMAQAVDMVGIPGLSVLIVVANQFASLIRFTDGRRLVGSIGFAAIIALLFTYGTFQVSRPRPNDGQLRIGLVQPGVDAETWASPDSSAVLSLLLRQSESLVRQAPDLIVWPETAVRADLAPDALGRVQQWVNENGIPILTGGVLKDDRSLINAVVLLTPDQTQQRYDKVHLVPMAEYVPGARTLPALNALSVDAGGVSGYLPGADARPLALGSLLIAPLVCFESVFSDHAREFVRRGARLIVVVAQDGWWARTFGYRQHFAINRLRAIETRRPVVQASVSGVSGVILPDGRVHTQTGWMERKAFIVRVPIPD